MSDSVENLTVPHDGMTLSALLWRRFRRPVPGLLGQVYDANPRLARLSEALPRGTEVIVPVAADRRDEVEVVKPITLWD